MNADTRNVEQLAALAEEQDLFATIEKICADPDPEHAAAIFAKLSRH